MARSGASERFLAARERPSKLPLIAAGLVIVALLGVIVFLLSGRTERAVELTAIAESPTAILNPTMPAVVVVEKAPTPASSVDPLLAEASPSPMPKGDFRIAFGPDEEAAIAAEAKRRAAADFAPYARAGIQIPDASLAKALEHMTRGVRIEFAWLKVLATLAREEGFGQRAYQVALDELLRAQYLEIFARKGMPDYDESSRKSMRIWLERGKRQADLERQVEGLPKGR